MMHPMQNTPEVEIHENKRETVSTVQLTRSVKGGG